MRSTIYDKLFGVLKLRLTETERYFYVYGMKFQKRAQAKKAGSYSGCEVEQFVNEFCNEIDNKCSELLKTTERLFLSSGRKLSKSQYEHLIAEYIHSFDTVIDSFSGIFVQEFETIESCMIVFSTLKGNVVSKIKVHIQAMEALSNSRIDKSLCWTATSTAIAAVSLLVSTFALIVTIIDSTSHVCG